MQRRRMRLRLGAPPRKFEKYVPGAVFVKVRPYFEKRVRELKRNLKSAGYEKDALVGDIDHIMKNRDTFYGEIYMDSCSFGEVLKIRLKYKGDEHLYRIELHDLETAYFGPHDTINETIKPRLQLKYGDVLTKALLFGLELMTRFSVTDGVLTEHGRKYMINHIGGSILHKCVMKLEFDEINDKITNIKSEINNIESKIGEVNE